MNREFLQMVRETVRLAVKAALAEQPAQHEPVAFEEWYARQSGDPEEIAFPQALRIAYCAGQDSVTTPQPSQREPLTDEQIAALVLRTVYEGDASTPHRDAWAAEIGIPVARAIEQEHGIRPNVM